MKVKVEVKVKVEGHKLNGKGEDKGQRHEVKGKR